MAHCSSFCCSNMNKDYNMKFLVYSLWKEGLFKIVHVVALKLVHMSKCNVVNNFWLQMTIIFLLLIFFSKTQVGAYNMNLDDYSYGILILFKTVEDTTLILLYCITFYEWIQYLKVNCNSTSDHVSYFLKHGS